jgi:hypothetical protein
MGQFKPSAHLAWSLGGLGIVVVAYVWCLHLSGGNPTAFAPRNAYVAFAGFILIAAAFERLAEATLGWWGTVSTKQLAAAAAASGAPSTVKQAADTLPARVGQRQALAFAHMVRGVASGPVSPGANVAAPEGDGAGAPEPDPDATEAQTVAVAAGAVADSAAKARATIALPLAAVAAVVCAKLGLFIVHAVGETGTVPTDASSYAIDALLTGLIVSGGSTSLHLVLEALKPSAPTV